MQFRDRPIAKTAQGRPRVLVGKRASRFKGAPKEPVIRQAFREHCAEPICVLKRTTKGDAPGQVDFPDRFNARRVVAL